MGMEVKGRKSVLICDAAMVKMTPEARKAVVVEAFKERLGCPSPDTLRIIWIWQTALSPSAMVRRQKNVQAGKIAAALERAERGNLTTAFKKAVYEASWDPKSLERVFFICEELVDPEAVLRGMKERELVKENLRAYELFTDYFRLAVKNKKCEEFIGFLMDPRCKSLVDRETAKTLVLSAVMSKSANLFHQIFTHSYVFKQIDLNLLDQVLFLAEWLKQDEIVEAICSEEMKIAKAIPRSFLLLDLLIKVRSPAVENITRNLTAIAEAERTDESFLLCATFLSALCAMIKRNQLDAAVNLAMRSFFNVSRWEESNDFGLLLDYCVRSGMPCRLIESMIIKAAQLIETKRSRNLFIVHKLQGKLHHDLQTARRSAMHMFSKEEDPRAQDVIRALDKQIELLEKQILTDREDRFSLR